MLKLKSKLFSVVVIGLLLVAGTSMAQSHFGGTYEGIVHSSGQDFPGITELKRTDTGDITGTYVFQGRSQYETGALSGCKLENLILQCIWTDAYGSGDWRVQFSPDFVRFRGKWYGSIGQIEEFGNKGGLRWDGVRKLPPFSPYTGA